MTSLTSNQLPIKSEGYVIGPGPAGLTGSMSAEPQSAMAVINDRLRGRMKYAVSIGLVLGAILGFAGYRFAPIKYSSIGNIHVAATGSAILKETSETSYLPRYEGVRRTQEILVISPRVIDRAMRDPELAGIVNGDKQEFLKKLMKGLRTDTEINTELSPT